MKYQQIGCPLCGSEISNILFRHARLANIKRTYASKESKKRLITKLNTNLCENCGMLYRNPLMSENELRQYYEKEYVEKFKQKDQRGAIPKQDSYDMMNSGWKKHYRKYPMILIKNNITLRGKRILDVGCGAGWLLAMLKEFSPAYRLGIEPSKQQCEEIVKNKEFDFKVLNGCLRDFSPEKIGTFDVVFLVGVLEHFSDPISELKACRNIMSDNSYIYIYTSNESPNWFLDINKRISFVHQLYFTPRTIKILFEKAGLDIIYLKSRISDMHILAKKSRPFDPNIRMNKFHYNLLILRYLIFKNIPSSFFSITSWFYTRLW